MHWKFPLNAMLCPRLSFCPDLFFLRFSRMAGNAVRAGGGSSEPEPNFTTLTSHNDRRKQSLENKPNHRPSPSSVAPSTMTMSKSFKEEHPLGE